MNPRRVHIIRAGKSDAQLLLELEQLLFPEDPWTEGMIREELASPCSDYFPALAPDEETRAEDDDPSQVRDLTRAGDLAFGYGGVKTLGNSVDIVTIGILPQARRTRLDRMLARALLEEGQGRGAGTVFLEVREPNQGARALYTSEGFREVGRIRRYLHNPLEGAITMLKELESSRVLRRKDV